MEVQTDESPCLATMENSNVTGTTNNQVVKIQLNTTLSSHR